MRRAVLLFGVMVGLGIPGAGVAAPAARQPIDDPWKICAREAARQEAAQGLPRHILAAIGKAESGRWVEENRANIAWPWTVTAEGEGRFFDTKAEALAEVRRLRARRVTNIDVGCMQVNLGYHGHQFDDPEQAMDPAANTAYAGKFLRALRETSADWMEAAGRYHSSLAERNEPYRAKVARLWDETRRDEAKRPEAYAALTASPSPENPAVINARYPAAAPVSALRPSAVPIDYERTAAINASFRAAKERATGGGIVAGGAEAAANRARLEAARFRLNPRDARASPTAERFTAKPGRDLARWRSMQAAAETN
jgi:hypothetical protein